MGKPPKDLSVDAEHGYSLGIYLEGDTARGRFIDALGETLKEVDFPASALPEGIGKALGEGGMSPDRLIGVGLATLGDLIAEEDRQHLASQVGVPVFAVPAIAASLRAERYFGSGGQLGRFLYFDSTSLEVGALVNGTVLAQPGTLSNLLEAQQSKASTKTGVLPGVLKGAVSLVQAEALVVGGLSAEDLENLSSSIGDLPVVPASAQASDPALAAAAVPLGEAFGV